MGRVGSTPYYSQLSSPIAKTLLKKPGVWGELAGMNSIENLITEWMEHLFIQKGQRLTGVGRYATTVRGFFAWLKQASLPDDPSEITRTDIGEWQKALFYDLGNISNRSRASKLSAVRSFFQWLKYSGLRHDDPTKGIPSPKIQETLPQKFSTEELRLLFSAPPRDTMMGLRDLAILKTLYAAGPRVSELIKLDLNHLVDTGGYIRLQIICGKGGKDRTVTMRTNPSRALRDWVAIRRGIEADTPAVFIRLKKGGVRGESDRLSDRSIQNILKKYARIVGIDDVDVFCHKMRSTFATDLYDSTPERCVCGRHIHIVGIQEVSILLGHEDIKTTAGYIAISDRVLRKTAIPDKRFNEIEEGGERDTIRQFGGSKPAL